MNNQERCTSYEYTTRTVPNEMDTLWEDSMKQFGWELTKKRPATVKHVFGPLRLMLAPLAIFGGPCREAVVDHDSATEQTLSFKRSRAIEHKSELNGLQHQFEDSARNIEHLEASKKTGAAIAAYAVGLIGTVFMALATFGYLAGMTPGFIFAAVPGFLCWLLPVFVHRSMAARRSNKIAPVVEAKYEDISDICRRAADVMVAA